jgi:hypothetical protein
MRVKIHGSLKLLACLCVSVIILNLLAIPGYFDVTLRDLGLMLGALALGTLSHNFDRA